MIQDFISGNWGTIQRIPRDLKDERVRYAAAKGTTASYQRPGNYSTQVASPQSATGKMLPKFSASFSKLFPTYKPYKGQNNS